MKRQQFTFLVMVLSFFQMLTSPSVQAGLIYDATADFVPGLLNPNGVWSYGTEVTPGASFIVNNSYAAPSGIGFGWSGAGQSHVSKFTSNAAGVLAGQLAMHPGSGTQISVLRFTTPQSGIYSLFSKYFTGDSGDTDFEVRHNNLQLVYRTSTTGDGTFSIPNIFLNLNDTIDLMIGAKGDWSNDLTPVSLVLSAVPEPSACLMFATATMVISVRRRRSC